MVDEHKKILYVQTSGTDTPERLYSPFILAQTAKAMDIEPAIYFLGLGLTVLRKGEAKEIQLGKFPTLKEVMDKTMEMGIPIYVCEQSKMMLAGMFEDVELEFIDGIKIVGAATLNDLVLESDATMWF